MAQDLFWVKVVTPHGELVKSQASEVVLQAFDGEVGILANHENFIGVLGLGAMKLITQGNSSWFVVDGGLYKVENGELLVLPRASFAPDDIDLASVEKNISELERQIENLKSKNLDSSNLDHLYKLERVRRDVYKRQKELN